MVVLQKPRGARPLWVVVSYAHTPKVAIHPPRSSHRAGLPLSQQTRSQVFQARRHPGVGGTPSLDGGTGERDSHSTPSLGRRTPRSGTGNQQGL